MARTLSFPKNTVSHVADIATSGELADLVALERAGMPLKLVALPPAVEDSLYRFNNLPHRLVTLYRDVDPFDPDEDILEEAEEDARGIVNEAHLLDDVIDGIYDALSDLPERMLVRRFGEARGEKVTGRRGALLALKHLVRRDWEVESVMARLTRSASVAVDARPVLVHPAGAAVDARLSEKASEILGRSVNVLGWDGALSGAP